MTEYTARFSISVENDAGWTDVVEVSGRGRSEDEAMGWLSRTVGHRFTPTKTERAAQVVPMPPDAAGDTLMWCRECGSTGYLVLVGRGPTACGRSHPEALANLYVEVPS